MTSLICDCNKTMSLDGPGLIQALGPDAGAGLETVHSTLCRREAAAFQRAAKKTTPVEATSGEAGIGAARHLPSAGCASGKRPCAKPVVAGSFRGQAAFIDS